VAVEIIRFPATEVSLDINEGRYHIVLGDNCPVCRAASRISFSRIKPMQVPIVGCREPGGCQCSLPDLTTSPRTTSEPSKSPSSPAPPGLATARQSPTIGARPAENGQMPELVADGVDRRYHIVLGDTCPVCLAASRISFVRMRPPLIPVAGCRDPDGCMCSLPNFGPAVQSEPMRVEDTSPGPSPASASSRYDSACPLPQSDAESKRKIDASSEGHKMVATALDTRPDVRQGSAVSHVPDGIRSSYVWCLRDGLIGLLAVLVASFLNGGLQWASLGAYLGSPSVVVPVVVVLLFAPAVGLVLGALSGATLGWFETWVVGPVGDEVLRAVAWLHVHDREAWYEVELLRSGWLLARSLALLAALTTVDAIAVERFGWFGWRGSFEGWTVATAAGFFVFAFTAVSARRWYVEQAKRMFGARRMGEAEFRARFTGTVTDAQGTPLANASVDALVGPGLTGAVLCGRGTSDALGHYTVDLQPVPPVTRLGATTHFLVNGRSASQTEKLPANLGTVEIDLTIR
jgi:hypothetical protein